MKNLSKILTCRSENEYDVDLPKPAQMLRLKHTHNRKWKKVFSGLDNYKMFKNDKKCLGPVKLQTRYCVSNHFQYV